MQSLSLFVDNRVEALTLSFNFKKNVKAEVWVEQKLETCHENGQKIPH